MDNKFVRDLAIQLERRRPTDNSYRPSRRYEDCMAPGEKPMTYSKALIIIDGYLERAEAARMFKHVSAGMVKARRALYRTDIYITLCAAGGCETGMLTHPERFGCSSVKSGLNERYAHIPNLGDLNDIMEEAARLPHRFDLVLFLTNGRFLNVFDERIKASPIYRNMLIILSESAKTGVEAQLRSLGLPFKVSLLRLRREDEENLNALIGRRVRVKEEVRSTAAAAQLAAGKYGEVIGVNADNRLLIAVDFPGSDKEYTVELGRRHMPVSLMLPLYTALTAEGRENPFVFRRPDNSVYLIVRIMPGKEEIALCRADVELMDD